MIWGRPRELHQHHVLMVGVPKRAKGLPLLKRWRKYRDNLTQERLAERTGLSQGMISQLENGQSDYTGGMLELLADALRCDPPDLVMRDPLDPEGIWSIWDRLKPAQRRQAVRLLKALADEEAA